MMDMYGFYTGKIFDAYKWLGAHVSKNGVSFRTFAPNAKRADLLWKDEIIPMLPIYDGNFYEVTVSDAKAGDLYEYRIYGQNGSVVDHCDPYGMGMELRPAHKSIVRNLDEYEFHDKKWMSSRTDMRDKPLNIYEMHLGSWRRKTEEETGWYRYDELAEPLIEYIKESGYNYVEFLPISEHPWRNHFGKNRYVYFA